MKMDLRVYCWLTCLLAKGIHKGFKGRGLSQLSVSVKYHLAVVEWWKRVAQALFDGIGERKDQPTANNI
jgi:hypothetical protein